MKSLIKISHRILSSTLIAKLTKAKKHSNGWFVGSTNLFTGVTHLLEWFVPYTDSASAPQRGVKVRTNVIGTPNMCVAQRHISRLRLGLTNFLIVTLCS